MEFNLIPEEDHPTSRPTKSYVTVAHWLGKIRLYQLVPSMGNEEGKKIKYRPEEVDIRKREKQVALRISPRVRESSTYGRPDSSVGGGHSRTNLGQSTRSEPPT
ncbi:Coiled-coil domain-containing protein [Dorcoceras hygrometricum]|uniref:Coiled-coil domain-containing protein n=1 Tax=Dorcoceras hygrometricum TaxID=472368 RepID=A0A2Z7AIC4_9LAMI|nr:Coiled-coil domain-containing protein [Dorcoceras hygrometricum]